MPDELVNPPKLVVTGADYFRDMCLHRQLTIDMNADITNGLYRMDHHGASVRSASVNFSSICRQPNDISSVLVALSCSQRDAHHELMSLIDHSST